MVGHRARLRGSENLGDFVLVQTYVREDQVLYDDLPLLIPTPALAEIQVALEQAIAFVIKLQGFQLKKIMRSGTAVALDNRNWELGDNSGPVCRLSLSRAVALDMESAIIAANRFRFGVSYGALICVSDRLFHAELKLPSKAGIFTNYRFHGI